MSSPDIMQEIVKQILADEALRNKKETKKLAQEATILERKRMDRLSASRKSVEKLMKSTTKDEPIFLSPKRISPPSSLSYYAMKSPEEIFEQGLKKRDEYMIKQAFKRGFKMTSETIDKSSRLEKLFKIHKPSSTKINRFYTDLLKEIYENKGYSYSKDDSRKQS